MFESETNKVIDPKLYMHILCLFFYLYINTWTFPYQPGYHPKTPILARDAVEDMIPEGSDLHETHYYGFFARVVSDMGYQPGGEAMASLLPVVTHMQKPSY
jgi:hypothetical protein